MLKPGTESILRTYCGRYPAIAEIEVPLRTCVQLLSDCFVGGGQLLVCGNGGSCADADHIVGELVKAFRVADMMTRLRISLLIAICIYFILIFYLLTKKRINLKYTLLWLALGGIMLVFIAFPQLLGYCTTLIGVETPVNGLFAVLFFAVLVILMSLTAIVSKLNEKSKRVIQVLALMEKRIRELEEQLETPQKDSSKQ